MNNYPKVLVISNNSFSKTNSNGRTLGSLFQGWPKDKIAQFCISTDGPDYDICDNYFCASDRDVLKATIKFDEVKRNELLNVKDNSNALIIANRIKRTPIKSIFRHIMWSLGIWKGRSFYQWLNDFKPNIVLIQSGDTAFMHRIAVSVSKKYHAKLCFFNTEGIFFLKKNYLYPGFCDNIFFPLYKKIYDKEYRDAMKLASYAVYLNDMLLADNSKVFSVPSCVIYNSSNLSFQPKNMDKTKLKFSYLGNFGFNRSAALADIADILQSIDKSYVLDVYGRASDEVKTQLNSVKGINYCGFTDYEGVKNVMENSDILFHAESQELEYEEGLRYGFSTKIADSLSSGRCFILYASHHLACSIYLKNNDVAWFPETKSELRNAILEILNDQDVRELKIKKSLEIAKKNHSSYVNSQRFQNILKDL